MTANQASSAKPRRENSRLRVLLAVMAAALGFYVFVRLDPSTVGNFGPVAVGIYDLFNQVPGRAAPITAEGQKLVEDVKALGGFPSVSMRERGFFGTIGQSEWAIVNFQNREFDDAALAKLASLHGDKITGLHLENTGVTDAGLHIMSKFTTLRHLTIRNYLPQTTGSSANVTDAGLIHLKNLNQLWTLNLSNLPITDAGLAAITDWPELMGLYLSDTKVEGHGLASMKSLSRLSILYLDGSDVREDCLKALSGATILNTLSLNRVKLTPDALPILKAIPKVERLELTGCGFLDEEIDSLLKSRPGLHVERK
jgi:hypothetical protein